LRVGLEFSSGISLLDKEIEKLKGKTLQEIIRLGLEEE
jgi:hypothetical protein